MGKQRHTNEEKMKILREYFEQNRSVSELAESYSLHPNAIYTWKKALFENGAEVLSSNKQNKVSRKQESKLASKVSELEITLQRRDTLIAEIVADNIRLKKNENGIN